MNILLNKVKPYIYSLLLTISFCFLQSIPLTNIFVITCTYVCSLILFIYSRENTSGYIICLSIILSFLIILGRYLIYIDESKGIELLLKLVITPIGTFLLFNRVFCLIFKYIDQYMSIDKKYSTAKLFIIGFLFIFILYIPLWIAEYPGIYTPDTITQISQAKGLYPLNNMNPLFHTLVLRFIYDCLSFIIKDINVCSFIVCLIQMLINSAIFSYVSLYAYKKTKNILVYLLSIMFFSLLSFNAFYSVTLSKDSVYAAFTALFVISIDNLCSVQSKKNVIIYIIVCIFYSLLRNNGYYSLVITLIILLVLVLKKKIASKVLVVSLVTFIISTIILFPCYSYIIDNQPNTVKNVSNTNEYKFRGNFLYVMPFQQVANVVVHNRKLNEKEEWLIEEYIPLNKIKDVYNPMLVDPLFDYITNHFKPTRGDINDFEYVKLWIELLFKHPQDYLEAYVNMTKYYFYPARYVNMYYTGIYNNKLGIVESPSISKEYKKTIENMYDCQKNIPFVSSILIPGVSVFVLIFSLFYCLSRKKYIGFYCMMPLLINVLILMAFVPINDEFRYIYPIVVCLPIMVSHLLSNENKQWSNI